MGYTVHIPRAERHQTAPGATEGERLTGRQQTAFCAAETLRVWLVTTRPSVTVDSFCSM